MATTGPNRYERPALERFGTFRELTQLGPDTGADLLVVLGVTDDGCNARDTDMNSEFACERS